MRSSTFTQEDGLCFSKSKDTSTCVPRARLAGAGVEVPSHCFPTPLPSREELELAQSDHASGEALPPSKAPVLQANPAGSLLSG